MSLTETIQSEKTVQLRRPQVREILKRHRGSISQIADELGITTTSVSMWLRGRGVSRRIEAASQVKALQLLKSEDRDAA